MSVEGMASILPKASLENSTGKYRLRSHLQSSYNIGINYIRDLSKSINISAGLHFTVGKYNWFEIIQGEDVPNGYEIYMEAKDLWGAFRFPLLVSKQYIDKKGRQSSIKTGLSVKYSGLMFDKGYGGRLSGSNFNYFNAQFPPHRKPWITFLGGYSRDIKLKNFNYLTLGLIADFSNTFFFKGNYKIETLNQPPSTGIYKVSGSSLGLSLNYVFTGANKLIVRKRILDAEKKNIPGLTREKILNDYVFKGNHLQFYYSYNSIFRSRLKRETGTHPVSATSTTGFSFALKYAINFNNQNSLITGPQVSMLGMNITTRIAKDDFSPPLKSDYLGRTFKIPFYMILSLPVSYEKRYFIKKRKYIYTNAGLKINFSLGYDSDNFVISVQDVTNRYIHVGGWDVNSNNNLWPWVSFPFHAGQSWLLKNNNLFQLGLVADLSITKYVDGIYQIAIPNKPLTSGRYSNTGSYWGISLQYLFTNANYRIRKLNSRNE